MFCAYFTGVRMAMQAVTVRWGSRGAPLQEQVKKEFTEISALQYVTAIRRLSNCSISPFSFTSSMLPINDIYTVFTQ